MTTKYEALLANQNSWVALKDIINEKNQIDIDFAAFLWEFSRDKQNIEFYLFHYVVLEGLVYYKVNPEIPILADPRLNPILLDNIPNYLGKNDIVGFPTNFGAMCVDLSKEDKKKDFITKIRIAHKLINIPFENIMDVKLKYLQWFNVYCTIRKPGQTARRNLNLAEVFDDLELDDMLTLEQDIVAKAYVETQC
ncbi:MAG: hypothetical protein CVU43_02405 [Chloroflexi bacterium HGW-Chloroflexi-5]|jgi:hypothetical protein|nr:MAG: hypothetical protein CVU43_02405 [Chloroflexi bacterium HGW-Chloroflexi-5]